MTQFFKDKNGKIVIWQSPNLPLWGWIVFSVIAHLIKAGRLHTGSQSLAQAWLFTWAYLEIRQGDSTFRRILGGLVLASMIFGFFSN